MTPLVNTPQGKQAWEKRYPEKKKKGFYWGAWDTTEDRPWEPEYTPHDPNVVPAIPEGLPCVLPCEELAPELLIDPTLITHSDNSFVDIVADHQQDYGAVRLDSDKALIEGQSKLRVVNAIDVDRFRSLFIDSMIGKNANASSK